MGAGDVDQGLSVPRVGGIEVDELRDAVGGPIGGARDHHAAVAVSDEDHVLQVRPRQEVHDIGDVAGSWSAMAS